MRHAESRSRKRRRHPDNRGSALLVSLMVMVGLSLLGLSFVAISETESGISANERNKTQTAAMAEAGAKTVVQWFQDPDRMNDHGLLPDNDENFKIVRTVSGYSGYYKPDTATELLCDTPFGPKEPNLLFGDEEHADVQIIDERNTASTTFIQAFNDLLFPKPPEEVATRESGRVTAIRIYAPPIVGGTLIGGFWVGGARYGVATIAVTAEKRGPRGNVVSQSVCRIVVAPFPLPGPGGAIQASGGIATNGAYEVHWGSVESEDTGNTYVKREWTSFPWFDAYDRPYIEYGLDSSRIWTANTGGWTKHATKFTLSDVVRPTNPAIAKDREYYVTNVAGTLQTAGTEPPWDADTHVDGGITWQKRVPTVYPIAVSTGPLYQRHAWLWEMLNRTVEDPWFHVRTRGRVDGKEYGLGPLDQPHAYDYASAADADMAVAGNYVTGGANHSHYFQYQTFNDRPLYKEVSIPKFDYDFWKSAAISGKGQTGVYYLQHKGSGNFTDGVITQDFEAWINDKEGFLFFDSENNLNPQVGAGTLVQGGADPCGAKGVIYMNYDSIKTTGCSGVDGWYNQPGEPFRDIGYQMVNEASAGINVIKEFTVDAEGNRVTDKGYNGEWDFQDLAWSNGGVAKNKIFDVCLAKRSLIRESDAAAGSTTPVEYWVPLPYYPGCAVGNNISMPTCNCSEPFEPYINIDYNGVKVGLQARWDDPTSAASLYGKKHVDEDDMTSAPVTCTAADVASEDGQKKCASNAYDKRGGLAFIEGGAGGAAIGVEGVLYNEGDYESTGNAAYYGSVVVKGQVSPNGTQEIWFDECLTKECWPPQHIPFPRVLITSTQIE